MIIAFSVELRLRILAIRRIEKKCQLSTLVAVLGGRRTRGFVMLLSFATNHLLTLDCLLLTTILAAILQQFRQIVVALYVSVSILPAALVGPRR